MNSRMIAAAAVYLTFLTTLAFSQSPPATRPRGASDTTLFTAYDSDSFRRLERARRTLDPARLDDDLLSAAVFHETNRRRVLSQSPPLAYLPEARRAAALQATAMARRQVVSHENPESPRLRTLRDRLQVAGLEPRFAGENVALTFGYRYQSGRPFYTRTENGRPVFSYQPGGSPIPRHTYVTFAQALVSAWMNSPGHRQNILHPAGRYLGASCRPAKSPTGLDLFYCAQVFFTPL